MRTDQTPCAACGHPLVEHQMTFDQAGRIVAQGTRADGTRLTCALAPAFQRPLFFEWDEGILTGAAGRFSCALRLVPGSGVRNAYYVGGVRVFRQGDLPYEARHEARRDKGVEVQGERADFGTLGEAMAQVERWARDRYDAPEESQ